MKKAQHLFVCYRTMLSIKTHEGCRKGNLFETPCNLSIKYKVYKKQKMYEFQLSIVQLNHYVCTNNALTLSVWTHALIW